MTYSYIVWLCLLFVLVLFVFQITTWEFLGKKTFPPSMWGLQALKEQDESFAKSWVKPKRGPPEFRSNRIIVCSPGTGIICHRICDPNFIPTIFIPSIFIPGTPRVVLWHHFFPHGNSAWWVAKNSGDQNYMTSYCWCFRNPFQTGAKTRGKS